MIFSAIGILLVLVVVFGVFLFFARRILRLALKLAVVGAVIFSLFAATAVGLWRGWVTQQSSSAQPAPIHSNQRANSNRRR